MRNLLAVMLAAVLGLCSGMAAAQDYPTHPITMIVPFPAGGATDTLARFLAEKMRGILGQPVIIENVAGAAGSIGVGRAARSAPDGYTLSIGTSTTHMLTGGLYALPFDLLRDLEPVIQIGSEPLLIVGKKALPLADPAVKQRLDDLGIQITPLAQQSPEALRAFQKAEAERWWPIIKASGIKAD